MGEPKMKEKVLEAVPDLGDDATVEEAMGIRPLQPGDPTRLSTAFSEIGWSKPTETFEVYLREQEEERRWVRVAEIQGHLAGYVTLAWSASDPVLRREGVPEIMDLNVLPAYRRRGIGHALMDAAESEARKRTSRVGLRVGLHKGYGAAQRLYVLRGYVPDGRGAIRNGEVVAEGAIGPLDDDLTLRMTLDLEAPV